MPRTKEQNKEIREKTKKVILDSALKMFSEKGFQSTSMSDIAKAAGVSKGLAYNYFNSKQQMAEAILKYVMDMMFQMYQSSLQESDPYLKLEKLIDITFNWMKESFDFWKMILAFLLQPGIFETSSEVLKSFIDTMFLEMEKIFKEIGLKNYATEARIFGALFDGIAIDYLIDIKNYPIDDVVNLIKARYSRDYLESLKK